MLLSPFLYEPENWLDTAHDPAVFAEIDAFMRAIGATKSGTTNIPWPNPTNGGRSTITTWHVPGYSPRSYKQLLSVAADRSSFDGPFFVSLHWALQDEYNRTLGIQDREQTLPNDLPWLGDFATSIVNLGYPASTVGEILQLLHLESDYGRAKFFTAANSDQTLHPARPTQMLLDNIHAAGLLCATPHLTTKLRRRLIKRAIPLADLRNLVDGRVPIDYIKTLYPNRSPYNPEAG